MCIPLRTDQGLSVWYPYGIGALSVIVTGSFTFHLFHGPFWKVCATRAPRNRANPIIIPVGVGSGEGYGRKKRLCELSPLLTGVGNTSSEQGPSPEGTFCPSPGLSPGWKAAGCYKHRLPSLQETGLVFVIPLALLPFEQQPTFFKTWSKARPLVFLPRKSLGLMGRSCWVPPLLAMLWQHGTLPWDTVGTTWALGVFVWAM